MNSYTELIEKRDSLLDKLDEITNKLYEIKRKENERNETIFDKTEIHQKNRNSWYEYYDEKHKEQYNTTAYTRLWNTEAWTYANLKIIIYIKLSQSEINKIEQEYCKKEEVLKLLNAKQKIT